MGTKCAVTGATGLLGGNLAIDLLNNGYEVVATTRSKAPSHLSQYPIKWVDASLEDVASLTSAFEGCKYVFHCAAAIDHQLKVDPWIREANVTGTANVIEAVRKAGVARLIHCSTVGAIGLSADGEPSNETNPWNMSEFGLSDAYVITKREAQDLVLAEEKKGLDAVIVNPTYMIGPNDAKPSSGKVIIELIKSRIPGYTLGTNNFVDVRDVARGMRLAAEKGTRGSLYILGGHNMTYKDFLGIVADVVEVPRLRLRIPAVLALATGLFGSAAKRLLGRRVTLVLAEARWSLTPRFLFSSAKAQRELGYTISPIEPAIRDALEWFRSKGMV